MIDYTQMAFHELPQETPPSTVLALARRMESEQRLTHVSQIVGLGGVTLRMAATQLGLTYNRVYGLMTSHRAEFQAVERCFLRPGDAMTNSCLNCRYIRGRVYVQTQDQHAACIIPGGTHVYGLAVIAIIAWYMRDHSAAAAALRAKMEEMMSKSNV